MSKQITAVALMAAALALAACDKGRSDPVAPQAVASRADTALPASPSGDASLPSAGSVFAPAANPAAKDAPGTRSNAAPTRAEELGAMPMAGQANDHSAPVSPAKGASAP